MLSQNPQKNKKFKFEADNADFQWDFSPEKTNGVNDENYRKLLREIYRYSHSMHQFDGDRFKIPDK
jgi:hypothetical protein